MWLYLCYMVWIKFYFYAHVETARCAPQNFHYKAKQRQYWLICRIPCHLFASHWIRIASIVFCFVLQRTPTNENNSGTEWQGIQQLLRNIHDKFWKKAIWTKSCIEWARLTCDHTLLPCLWTRGRRAWYIYLSDHMFKNQSLVFSLIGRETIVVVCGLLSSD